MEKLLVVEDVQDVLNQLKSGLGSEYDIVVGTDRADAMELFLKHSPRVVALDLGLPPDTEGSSEGVHCLEWMVQRRPSTKVVVLTSRAMRENAYHALARGAYDFHLKPVVPDELRVVIRRAFHLSRLEEQSSLLKEALERTTAGIEGIAGQCVALQRLFPPGPVVSLQLAERMSGDDLNCGTCRDAPLGGEGGVVAGGMAQPGGVRPQSGHLTLREARDRVERRMVLDAIGNCGGNMSRASEFLGVSRPALYDLMKKYGISRRITRG
ncbi:MAG TPA: DNA-binding response regulator [Geobacter sp.]|nr:DNA-binding response regulator [Geobacter sp.]